jgi:tRNA A37 threonylcarbamoyladenosine modification protein TsaB
MKAILQNENGRPCVAYLIAKRYNKFYAQFYIECRLKTGERIYAHSNELYVRAAHLKDKYKFAGKPAIESLPIGNDFTFNGV